MKHLTNDADKPDLSKQIELMMPSRLFLRALRRSLLCLFLVTVTGVLISLMVSIIENTEVAREATGILLIVSIASLLTYSASEALVSMWPVLQLPPPHLRESEEQ